MDRIIYTAMNGARQIMLKQASNNHNLANLNTTGFRADLDAFRSKPMYGPGQPSRVYVQDNRAGVDFAQGQLITTGNDLDVAIGGEGFIAVQDKDGNESYTRRGDLRISPGGVLENGAGYPVMGNGGPIAIPPYEKLDIGRDGTISIKPLGQSAASMAVIDRIKLVNPNTLDLEKTRSGLFRLTSGEDADPDASVKLETGMIETSNVNPIEAMVNMIELARQFEMHVNILKQAQEMDTSAATVARLG